MSQEASADAENSANLPSKPATPANTSPGSQAELTSPRTIRQSILVRFSKRQIVLALAIAAVSDLLCAFLVTAPPLVWAIDVATALLLFAVLGWHWIYLPGLVLEAIPGFSLFPFWLLVVIAVFIVGTPRPKLLGRKDEG